MQPGHERWAAGLARQVRHALNCGTCTEEQIAAAEGLEVRELRALLARFPAPLPARVVAVAATPAAVPVRTARHDVAAMHREYQSGATLQQVGMARGITRERVRQLFVAAGLPTRDL